MKNLLLLTVLVISTFAMSSANAQSRSGERCRAELLDQQGYVLQSFTGNGYYRQDACNDARFKCQDELRWRQSRGNRRGLRCRVGNGNGNGTPTVSRSCNVDMRGQRGHIIRTFRATARGYDRQSVKREACRKALRQCNRERNQQGRYRATCNRNSNGGGNRYDPPRRSPRNPAAPHRGGRGNRQPGIGVDIYNNQI